MIDLSKRKQELYKIRLEDGTILKLKKPTQSMLMTMINFSKDFSDEFELINELFVLLTKIFNRNINDKTFTCDDIQEMLDVEIAMEILQDYLTYTLSDLGK